MRLCKTITRGFKVQMACIYWVLKSKADVTSNFDGIPPNSGGKSLPFRVFCRVEFGRRVLGYRFLGQYCRLVSGIRNVKQFCDHVPLLWGVFLGLLLP